MRWSSLPSPHLEIGSHEIRRKLQVADAGQAESELLFLSFQNELFFLGLCGGGNHVGYAGDRSRFSRDAAVGLTFTIFLCRRCHPALRGPLSYQYESRCDDEKQDSSDTASAHS